MNRPTGVTILAVLQAILSGMSLLAGISILALKDVFLEALVATPEFQQSAQDLPPGVLEGVATATGIIVLISGLIGLLLAYGLFKLKGWAWIVTLIFQILGILSSIINLINGISPGVTVIQLVIAGVIVYYLLRPEVKRAFGQTGG